MRNTMHLAQQPRGRESQLARGLRAIELLASGPLPAASVASNLSVNRSTALRLLGELERVGVVSRLVDKRFAVVPERLIAMSGMQHRDTGEVVAERLRRVRDELGEAANFSVPIGPSMVYVAFCPSRHELVVTEGMGTARPMQSSAIGRAYLAALSERELAARLRSLSLAKRQSSALVATLAETRARGYALDIEETIPGVTCVAIALGSDELVAGAAGVSAPSSRLGAAKLERAAAALRTSFVDLVVGA